MTSHFNYHPCSCSGDNQSVESSVPVVNRLLWPGNRTFLEVASMVVTWWIVAFLHSEKPCSFAHSSMFMPWQDYTHTRESIWMFFVQLIFHLQNACSVYVSKVKLSCVYYTVTLHNWGQTPWAYETVWNVLQSLPQPIALMSVPACRASGRLRLFTWSLGKPVRD